MTRPPMRPMSAISTAGASIPSWSRPRARTIAGCWPRSPSSTDPIVALESELRTPPARRRGLRRPPRRHARGDRASGRARPSPDRGADGAAGAPLGTGAAGRAASMGFAPRGSRTAPCRSRPSIAPMPRRPRSCDSRWRRAADRAPRLQPAAAHRDACGRSIAAASSVGRDLALVGWDDAPLAELSHPPIAVVDRDPRGLGRRGGDAGAAAARPWRRPRRRAAARVEVRPARFIPRASCMAAPDRIADPARRDKDCDRRLPMAELFSFSPERRALVTGGASGLGLGAARRLLEIGAPCRHRRSAGRPRAPDAGGEGALPADRRWT